MRDAEISPFRAIFETPARGDDPAMPPRPRGSRRPHTDNKVLAVRRLIEETTLTYGEIAKRTGVGRASICCWMQDGGWKRPAFAPRATDTVPRWRASAKLKRRTLAARLNALAERHIRELEEAGCVDADKLGEALELLKMAKVAAQGRSRRRTLLGKFGEPREPMRPMGELCVADVDLHRAPRAALDDFLANRAPPSKGDGPRQLPMPQKGRQRRASRFTSDEYHRRMLEKE